MLAVAALMTVVLMARAALWNWRPNPFVGWALFPYALLAGYVFLRGRTDRSGSANKAGLWVSFLALLFTAWCYLGASFGHVSSTSALVFLVVPLYLSIGGPVLGEILVRVFAARSGR